MAEKNGLYKCNVCGNLISIIDAQDGQLVCCNQPMELLKAKTSAEERNEKHVPVIEIDDNKVKVKVGSIPHPMEEEHYIQLIEVLYDGDVIANYRPSPGELAEAEWEFLKTDKISAREYCNLHSLWKSD